ncbi:MAG: YidC/Oxa1 family membrane protein insertase, partial [Oscillospiraceae bacterium]|nr:YidC/Oxa1 family membrane protein insertase [Oscillospiraceae bacterium]
ILIALYRAIRFPLTTMMGVASELLAEGGAIATKLAELGYDLAAYTTSRNAAFYEQIYQSQFITDHLGDFQGLSEKLQAMSYRFLGINLGQVPSVTFWNWETVDWNHIGLFLIPIVSAALSYFSMKVSQAASPQTEVNNQSSKGMMLTMPLISVWICFTMPGIMGIYWIAQSVFAIVQDVLLTRIFNKQLDVEDADRIAREKARAAELEAKREETERLKAAGITVENRNTSKKNKKAAAAQKETERRAAEARAERAKRRAALGIVDDIPASQVGNRRYARGRAYVPDRYTNPDEAEEKTLAAAEESESYVLEHPELAETAAPGLPEELEDEEVLEAEEAPEDEESPADEAEAADEEPEDVFDDAEALPEEGTDDADGVDEPDAAEADDGEDAADDSDN